MLLESPPTRRHGNAASRAIQRYFLASAANLSAALACTAAILWSALAVPLAQAAALHPLYTGAQQQQQQHSRQLTFRAPSRYVQNHPCSSSSSSRLFSLTSALHFGSQSRFPDLRARHDFRPDSYSSLVVAADIAQHDSDHYTGYEFPVIYGMEQMQVRQVKHKIWKPSHPARSDIHEAARRHKSTGYRSDAETARLAGQLSWKEIEVDAPDVTDVETLATLAKMSSNAYLTPTKGWYDISNGTLSNGRHYNLSTSFGWAEDGLRGHIFSSGPNNDSIIVALKGTSIFLIGGPTAPNDQFNDNILFSCCCARVNARWKPVCGCYGGGGEPSHSDLSTPRSTQFPKLDKLHDDEPVCNLTCLENSVMEDSVYFPLATDLFNNITQMYPKSNIWLTGHSLGGSLAALLAVTFGVPCVTFEAPGELLPARRLHLPLPPGMDWDDKRPDFGITHVYANSDPIPQGSCTGLSFCYGAGFALETKCHTGQSIIYDTRGKLGWAVNILSHRITTIIERLLIPNWDRSDSAHSVSFDTEKDSLFNSKEGLFREIVTSISNWLYQILSKWQWPWKWKWSWPWKWHWPWQPKQPDASPPDDHNNHPPRPTPPDEDQPPKETPSPRPVSHVPPARVEVGCYDCSQWTFYD